MSFDGSNPLDEGASENDEFGIFGQNLVALPEDDLADAAKGAYKYMRLIVPHSDTYEGYYRIAAVGVGPLHQIQSDATCHTWADLRHKTLYPVNMAKRSDGTIIPKSEGLPRREVSLKWNGLNPSQSIGFQSFIRRAEGAMVPVVYLPITRRNGESKYFTRSCYEAILGRMNLKDMEMKPSTAAEVWESAAIKLSEIRTEVVPKQED